jgi:predicted membrane protein
MENEVFDQVKTEITEYGKSLGEVGRLRLIGIVSRVLGLFLLIFTIVLCVFAVLSFGAVSAIHALSACMPVWAASLLIGTLYIVLIILAIVFRKPLFIHPFIGLLAKQIHSEEELALKTMEAEHKAELQRVRLECHVENATRELNFYADLFSRAWNFITGKLRK